MGEALVETSSSFEDTTPEPPLELDPEVIERLKAPETLEAIKKNKNFIQSGNWIKGKMLGSGGEAEVFLVSDQKLGRSCVLRNARVHMESDFVKIKSDCELLMLLKHPCIVDYYDFLIDQKKFRVKLYMEAMKVFVYKVNN